MKRNASEHGPEVMVNVTCKRSVLILTRDSPLVLQPWIAVD